MIFLISVFCILQLFATATVCIPNFLFHLFYSTNLEMKNPEKPKDRTKKRARELIILCGK